jgi:hypothetical protein
MNQSNHSNVALSLSLPVRNNAQRNETRQLQINANINVKDMIARHTDIVQIP